MKKRFLSKFTVAVLAAAIVTTALPFTAMADEADASELTPVDGTETASSITAVSSGTSGIESAAVGSEGTGTVAPSSTETGASSNVVVAGSSSGASGPGVSGSSSSGNVIVAGGGGSGIITTEGEKSNTIYSDILGGATLTMFHSETGAQILSCMIVTSDGSIIMVDGGYGEDAAYLTSQLAALGGHVSAWLLTHPHADHAGALYTILQNEDARYAQGLPAQITVDAIYYALGDASWYQQNDPDEYTMAAALIGEFSGLPSSMLHQAYRGETFQVGTATVQVLNDRYDQATANKGNNAGIVYKVILNNGVSILFLGDLAREGADHLLANIDQSVLKSDIVQATHHGQADVSEDFYRLISPTIVLWPTPEHLWADPGVTYTVEQTKEWMVDLGVQRNYCMKDGDQTIR